MSDAQSLQLLKAFALLAAGLAFAWWQFADLRRARRKREDGTQPRRCDQPGGPTGSAPENTQ